MSISIGSEGISNFTTISTPSTVATPCPALCEQFKSNSILYNICLTDCEKYMNCPITPSALYNASLALTNNLDLTDVFQIQSTIGGTILILLIMIFVAIAFALIVFAFLSLDWPTALVLSIGIVIVFTLCAIIALLWTRQYLTQRTDDVATSLVNTLTTNAPNAVTAYIEALKSSKVTC